MSARPFSNVEYLKVQAVLGVAGRERDHLLVALGCATGFRITELLSLSWEQIFDGEKPRTEVLVARRNLKGGSGEHCRAVRSRRVPLNERAQEAIAGFAAVVAPANRAGAVFRTDRSKGGPMNRSQAFRILVSLAQECEISQERISTHSLRKTFVARIYAASGNDLIKTQRIVGHSSPLTTARYLETDQGELDNLVRNLAA